MPTLTCHRGSRIESRNNSALKDLSSLLSISQAKEGAWNVNLYAQVITSFTVSLVLKPIKDGYGFVVWSAVAKYRRMCLAYKWKFIFSEFWRLEVQDQGSRKFGFWRRFSFGFADGCVLDVSSCGLFSPCVWRETSLVSLSSSFVDTKPSD